MKQEQLEAANKLHERIRILTHRLQYLEETHKVILKPTNDVTFGNPDWEQYEFTHTESTEIAGILIKSTQALIDELQAEFDAL